jgi:hypothetical protein
MSAKERRRRRDLLAVFPKKGMPTAWHLSSVTPVQCAANAAHAYACHVLRVKPLSGAPRVMRTSACSSNAAVLPLPDRGCWTDLTGVFVELQVWACCT